LIKETKTPEIFNVIAALPFFILGKLGVLAVDFCKFCLQIQPALN